jgi:hypothetical protein
MATDEAAQKAIEKFHQHDMEGRQLVVNEAKPKTEGGGAGFGRGNRGGGGDDFGAAGGRREPRW